MPGLDLQILVEVSARLALLEAAAAGATGARLRWTADRRGDLAWCRAGRAEAGGAGMSASFSAGKVVQGGALGLRIAGADSIDGVAATCQPVSLAH